MAIVAKHNAVIVPKYTLHYDPTTFADQKDSRFMEVSAEEVLAKVQPISFDFLPGRSLIAVDTETYFTGIDNHRMPANVVRRWIQAPGGSKYFPNDFPFCISLSDGTHCFVVYDTLQNGFKEFKKLEPLLMDQSIDKCGHNMDYDFHMLANARVNMRGRFYDTMHLSKLTRADAFTHKLCDVADEIMCEDYPTVTKFEHMLASYKAQYRVTDYRQFPKELMTQYTSADTWNVIWAFKALYPRMLANEQLPLFEIESQTMMVTYHMERDGVKIDPEYENVLIPELQSEAEAAEREIYKTAGTTFNINSSQQLYGVLQKLGFAHLIKFTKPTEIMISKGRTKGNPCFKANEMERLESEGVPLIADIMTYRKAEKLLNTFAIKLYEMRDFDNLVHCNINTMEAKTGRFSISAPSMQNMPRRKDSRVRQAFIANEGFTLYDFDFKAQESLIMTHYSRAPYLLNIINNGGDIHKAIAAVIYSLDMKDITKALREIAKSVEFAIVYGAGADKVKAMTGLTLEEARSAITTFKRKVPEVDIFIKTANNTIKERGCIRTILGRRVYSERGREYACVNYLCQGSAADSTKGRMVEIYKFLRANNFKTRMILQVHDSLLQMVWEPEIEQGILGYLRWLQTERKLFRVTVQVDVAKCAPTWRDKEDVDVEAIKPPDEMLEKMEAYNIWEEGIL